MNTKKRRACRGNSFVIKAIYIAAGNFYKKQRRE